MSVKAEMQLARELERRNEKRAARRQARLGRSVKTKAGGLIVYLRATADQWPPVPGQVVKRHLLTRRQSARARAARLRKLTAELRRDAR